MNLEHEQLIKELLDKKNNIEHDIKKWKEAADYRLVTTKLSINKDSNVILPSNYIVFIDNVPFKEMKEFVIRSLTNQISKIDEKLKTL